MHATTATLLLLGLGIATAASIAQAQTTVPLARSRRRPPTAPTLPDMLVRRYQDAADPGEARRIFGELRSAAERSPHAAFLCGQLAATEGTIISDRAAAVECLERAAKADIPQAQFRLAALLLAAPANQQDRANAERWLTAAAQIHPESVYALALLRADEQPDRNAARRPSTSSGARRLCASAVRLPPRALCGRHCGSTR